MRVPPALSLALNELACRTTKEEFTEVCLRIAIHHRGEDIPNAKTVMNSLVATFWTFDQDDILCPHGENSTWTCIICNNLADEASNTWRNGV